MLDIKDLLLTPIFAGFIYILAYGVRNRFTNRFTKKYFIPALTLKLIGAAAMGIIYQFYYGNGDTLEYHRESMVIFNAFMESPLLGIKLLWSDGTIKPDIYKYAIKIDWFTSKTEYMIVKFGGFFSLFTFKTYTGIALLFALFSFSGAWAMYITFLKIAPGLTKEFAIAVFFLPSVFFWGSGFMKDSVTLSALGWLFYGFYTFAIQKKSVLSSIIIILLSSYLIYTVKVYILLSFLPPALLWIFNENNSQIKNTLLRNLLKPLFLILGAGASYFAGTTLTEGDVRYDVSNIAERTKINNEYLSKYTASGSAYDIGTFDGSITSILTVAPEAIVVSLFRPFLWEVKNPFMLLSALEALLFLYLTLKIFWRVGFFKTFALIASEPIVLFCMIFSLVFAFAVGTNSGNFGTLVRYKIPLMPFYLAGLYIMQAKVRSRKRIKTKSSNLVRS